MWVIVYAETNAWDDGIGKVVGPFNTEAQAEAYAQYHATRDTCYEVKQMSLV